MATLPVIDDCFRITINFNQIEGVRPHNVIHVVTATANVPDIAANLNDSWQGLALASGMPNSYEAETFDVLPLDGTHAAQQFNMDEGSWSTASTGPMVPEAAACVSLHTALRGPAHRGRVFIGPLAEEAIANGVVQATVPEDLFDAWSQFATNLAGQDPTMALVVASYAHASAAPVNNIIVRTAQATQRRRLLQQR